MSKNIKKSIKLVVTGGHHDPAIAVIEKIKKLGDFEFHWIGHRVSMRGEATPSLEFRTITKLGFSFYNLKTGKLYHTSPLEWVKILFGFWHALYLLLKIRPKMVLSFGGYLAVPVVLAAWVLRIPAVTHEQTVRAGWGNRFIAPFVKRIFISWEESFKYFPPKKTILTGNPIRSAVFEAKTDRFEFKNNLPTIYVTGGKQGSHVINEALRKSLSAFLERYNIIHQTGAAEAFKDYQKLVILCSQLPPKLQSRYIVQEFIGLDEIGAVLKEADLVIGRSGANTVTELAALGIPAILIPIPWVSHNEQFQNAQILSSVGAALILPQDRLTSASLLEAVDSVFKNIDAHRKGAEKARRLVQKDAALKIAHAVTSMLD